VNDIIHRWRIGAVLKPGGCLVAWRYNNADITVGTLAIGFQSNHHTVMAQFMSTHDAMKNANQHPERLLVAMALEQHSSSFKVYVRWRPLSARESSAAEIEHGVAQHESWQSILLSSQPNFNRSRTWKSGASFAQVSPASAINYQVFACVVDPTVPQVMDGATCNFFAYGQSGSGKTHTIIGYNHEDDQHLGLCLSTARNLFRAVEELNVKMSTGGCNGCEDQEKLCVAVRLYEVRGKFAYDIFNNGTECYVREGPDGQTHIRGQTEILEGGKVRVQPIVPRLCWSFDELRKNVLGGLAMRKTGSSSVHDESSRTHAVLEIEVINKALLKARQAVIERESELVPIGKRATDIYLKEHKTSLIHTPEGQHIPNPERPLNQGRIDAAEAEKSEYETRVKAAQDAVGECFKTRRHPCLGGKFVFVDLAGSSILIAGTQLWSDSSRPCRNGGKDVKSTPTSSR
jgi:hypothetical protein